MNEEHEMKFVKEFEDGSQEFLCPICKRKIVVHWPPNYSRHVIVVGNENVYHSGTNALGLSINLEEDTTGELEDPYLDIWKRYID